MRWKKATSFDDIKLDEPCGYPYDKGVWKYDGEVFKKNAQTGEVFVSYPSKLMTIPFHWSLIHVKR